MSYLSLASYLKFTAGSASNWTSVPTNVKDALDSLAAVAIIAVNKSVAAWGTTGVIYNIPAATYTDTSSATNATVDDGAFITIGQPTLATTNTGITYTQASTLLIKGAPTSSSVTITSPFALKALGQGMFIVGGDNGPATYAPANNAAIQGLISDNTVLAGTGARYGIYASAVYSSSTDGVCRYKAGYFWAGSTSSGNLTGPVGDAYAGNITGVDAHAYHQGTGTIATMFPVRGQITIYQTSAGVATDTATFFADNPLLNGQTLTNYSGLWIKGGSIGGTIGTRYGVKIDTQTGGSTIWGLWVQSDPSFFGGTATFTYNPGALANTAVAGITLNPTGTPGGTATTLQGINVSPTVTGSGNYNGIDSIDTTTTHSGSGVVSTLRAIFSQTFINSSGNCTDYSGFTSRLRFGGSGNLTGTVRHFTIAGVTKGSTGDVTGSIIAYDIQANIGRSTAVDMTGYNVIDQTKGSGNVYGFRGQIAAATGKYNCYMDGTADNYFAGKLLTNSGIGVGNSVAATTPGSVTSKIEVFDQTGASLGFIPVYGSIT